MCNELKKNCLDVLSKQRCLRLSLEYMVVKEEEGSNIVFSLGTSRLNSAFD